MNRGKARHFQSNTTKTVLILALIAVGLCITGCGNDQMTRIKDNQASLQILVESNARQMADVVTCMEQSQKELQATIKNLRDTTKKLSSDMAFVTTAHEQLQQTVQEKNQVIAGKVASVEKSQQALHAQLVDAQANRKELSAGIVAVIDKHIALEDVVQNNNVTLMAKVSTVQDSQTKLQNELKSVKAGIETAVSNISAVAKAQMNLEKTINQKLATQIAALQQDQQKQRADIDVTKSNIDKLMQSLSGLESNLTQLEKLLKDDTKTFSDAIELMNQRQVQIEDQGKRDARGLAGAIDSVGQQQDSLSKQMQQFQADTQKTIDNLKTDLERVRTAVSSIRPLEVARNESIHPETMEAEPNKDKPTSQ